MNRYDRQKLMFSEDEMNQLTNATVGVIGCGGLGGYIIEMLARIGISSFVIVDSDVADVSNLNRQLLVTEQTIGQSKISLATNRISAINQHARVTGHSVYIDSINQADLFNSCDIILDATDNIPSRFILETIAKDLNIPLIHGAISGWYGHVCAIFPGDFIFDKIYPNPTEDIEAINEGNPSFTPATIGSIQVSECIKVLLNRDNILRNKLLMINLLDNEYSVIDI